MVELKPQDYTKNKQLYLKTEETLRAHLDKDTPISHVGSTAVPNIVGKNIIDILVGAQNGEQFAKYSILLEEIGYFGSLKSKTEIYQFFASKESETGDGDVHIHLAVVGTDRYEDFITLRDYLLDNPQEAAAYSEHKKLLVGSGITNRQEYRKIKSEYVSALLNRARQNKKSK